ncbi:MAG TPA: AMP-binding protein [Acidimicrobiales bacterium]
MLDRNQVLPYAIADLAQRAGATTAVLDVTGPTVTYAELHDTILGWAAAYRRAGIDEGQTVVTMLPNSLEAYYAWLGVAWLRAIEVPANNMYLGTMLKYLVENSEAETVLLASRFVDRLAAVSADLPRLKRVIVPDATAADPLPDLPCEVIRGDEFLGGVEPATDLEGPSHRDTMAIIYTSGTTGPSKGVLVPWAELYWFSTGMPDDMTSPGDRYYSPYPAFHISGKAALYVTALSEATLVIREMFSATEFWDDVRKHNITVLALLGPLMSILMQMPERDDDADNAVHSVGGGPIIPEIEEFKRRFGIPRHTTGFGMTETGIPITAGWNPPNFRTCGRPREGRPGYEIRVVDEHGEPVRPGEVGELIVRCSEPWCMNLGYWKMPDKTAEAWRHGWFHTGDAFKVDDDGWLYFVDRIKDAIRRRGENISSFEVEAHINQHPAVQESAAVGVPSDLGEDDVKISVVVKPTEELTGEELIEFLIPRMPRFMVPRYVEIVTELPKTEATFRTQKVRLREQALNDNTWDREQAGISLPKE